jgi:Na+-transporting methylmalonyl-CoA/oxaloacetate decarboxylase gamma subunit
MIANVLAVVANANGNYYFENKAEALIYALIGFLVVFVGIALIILVIWLVGLLMKKTNNLAFLTNRKKKAKQPEQAQEQTSVSQEQNKEVLASADEVSDEVKAAIVAALMAFYQTEQPQCEFTVKRIKRL